MEVKKMKFLHLIVICMMFYIISCTHTQQSSGPITTIQIRSLDLVTIRPRMISLFGRDSSGLDAISMITTYEDFLSTQYPLDTTHETPPEASIPKPPYDDDFPPPNPTITKNPKTGAPPHRILQLLRQQGRSWIVQLTDYNNQYYQSMDIGYAKKGVAAGYNALLSGPTLNEIQKIEEKLMPLIDTLQAHRKTP